jgi:hypothetical protein
VNTNVPLGHQPVPQVSNPAIGVTETWERSEFDSATSPILGTRRDAAGRITSQLTFNTPGVNFDKPGAGVTLTYVQWHTWLRYSYPDASTTTPSSIAVDVMVNGFETPPADMPRSGSATYDTVVDGSAISQGKIFTLHDSPTGPSTATFGANFAAGTVSTTIAFQGREPGSNGPATVFGNASGTGNITSNGSAFSGILSGVGLTTGSFTGGFFGPQAAEMGYAFFFDGGGYTAVGTVLGKKQ